MISASDRYEDYRDCAHTDINKDTHSLTHTDTHSLPLGTHVQAGVWVYTDMGTIFLADADHALHSPEPKPVSCTQVCEIKCT